MHASTLPPVFQAPAAPLNVTPHAAFGANGTPGGAGPDSFARMLDAADTRRQAEAAAPAAAETPPANAAPQPAARPAQGSKPAPAQNPAQRAPTGPAGQAPADGEGRTGSTTTDNTTDDTAAADAGSEDSAATEPRLGADAAALLAGLAALPRPAATATASSSAAAAAAAAAPGGVGARNARGPNLAAVGTRTDAGSDPTGRGGAGWPGFDAAPDVVRAHAASTAASRAAPDAGAAAATPFARLMAGARAADAASEGSSQPLQDSSAQAPPLRSAATETGTLPGMLPVPAGLAGGLPGASSATAGADARLPATPGSPEFAGQLGAQLTTFVREGVQHARLELHPVELGPVTVQIQLDGGNAQVNLSAEHAFTRQALEEALPALAGSLREAGLTLSGGGVFEQPRQPQPDSNPAAPGARGERDRRSGADTDTGATTAAPTAARRRGVVDLVA